MNFRSSKGAAGVFVATLCCPFFLHVWHGTGEGQEPHVPAGIAATIEPLDSVSCWCSPLWGHHAPKIVEGRDGVVWAALFSGDYPEANVQILKRSAAGKWERGRTFSGAYQPSLLFVDGEGRLNVLQNSQTAPIIHFRSSDDSNLMNFDTVAVGNGQEDGRGWYVGAGICNDTVFMAYNLLSYDLFLTWKPVRADEWRPPVKIHAGSVDAVKGNHAWTRPRFQFAGRKGFFVVNETSDGSVKNSYNAVQLVTFDLANPAQFATECLDRVPQGFGSYSPDFAVSADGRMYSVVERTARLYDTPFALEGEPGVYVFSRSVAESTWTKRRLFKTVSDASLFVDAAGEVTLLRTVAMPQPASREPFEARRTHDHGVTWDSVSVTSSSVTTTNPSHLQVLTSANNWNGRRGNMGIFEDRQGSVPESKNSRYRLYFLRVSNREVDQTQPESP